MQDTLDPVKAFFTSISQIAQQSFNSIPATIIRAFSGINGNIRPGLNTALATIASFTNQTIRAANKFITSFNSIAKGANSIPGGKYIPYLSQSSGFTYSALAEGAIIPPNAPFMALLGDQTNGRNLEAPESLIREIMREELGNASKGGSYQFVAQLNRRTLFDEIIDEAEMRQLRTGSNPFML